MFESLDSQLAPPPHDPVPQSDPKKQIAAQRVQVLFLCCLALLPIEIILAWFDTTTELYPTHDGIAQALVAGAAICALLVAGLTIYLTRTLKIMQRLVLPLVYMFVVFIGLFMATNHIASLLEGAIDFPADKTETRQLLIGISRAYRTHGKSANQYIQTTPIWSNLEITHEDFVYMQTHRAPGDPGLHPDEIRSRGYFCARVTVEQTPSALRILHSGSQKLPKGTVIPCPLQAKQP